jgi:hypothetical protein
LSGPQKGRGDYVFIFWQRFCEDVSREARFFGTAGGSWSGPRRFMFLTDDELGRM